MLDVRIDRDRGDVRNIMRVNISVVRGQGYLRSSEIVEVKEIFKVPK